MPTYLWKGHSLLRGDGSVNCNGQGTKYMAKNKQSPASNDTASAASHSYRGVIFRYSLAAALVIVTSAICILAHVAHEDFEKELISQTQEQLMVIAKSEIIHMTTRVDNIYSGLKLLATNPDIQRATVEGHSFQDIKKRDGYFPEGIVFENFMEDVSAIYRLDDKGIVQSRVPWKDRTGADYSHKPGVRAVLETHKPYVTRIFKTNSGKKTMSVCYPIFHDEQFVGVLRALVSLKTIQECAKDSDLGSHGYAQIIDDNGTVIAHPKFEQVGQDMMTIRKETFPEHDWSELKSIVEEMRKGQEGVGTYHSVWWNEEDHKIVRKITAYTPFKVGNQQWSMGITMGYDEISSPVKAHEGKLLFGEAFVITAFILAFIWFYKTQKEKTKLRSQAESAENLREINAKLKSEVACRIEVEEGIKKINRELEIAAEKANLMAKEAVFANESKSQFLANMSHEIRTPMNAIIGFSDILADEEMADEHKNYVEIIRDSGQNLLTLINDILDFSKIEAGKLETEVIDSSLSELIESTQSLLLPKATQKGLEFKILQCGKLPSHIQTDPVRVRQCLINLVNNAIKFTEQGHVYINVAVDSDDGKSYVRFDVEDTGIGIEPEQLEEIFNSFTQADGSTCRKYGGTGLGLAITKQLAELLGGKVSVSSELGKGSVFSLLIPALVTSDSMELDRYAIANTLDQDEGNASEKLFCGHVLVAEDSKANQMLIKLLLERLGFEVTVCEDGQQALEKTRDKSFDIVFMDIQMPNLNGYEATRIMRKEGITTPIVALTAGAMKGDNEKCFDAGCDEYLTKPVDRDKLVEIIGKYFVESSDEIAKDLDSLTLQSDELAKTCTNSQAGGDPQSPAETIRSTQQDDHQS